MVIRYDAAGNELWIARGTNSWYDTGQAVAVDAAGNSYFGTSILLTNSETDYFLRKLDPAGETLWTRTYDAGYSDEFNQLALDHAGNLVVAGTSVVDPAHARDTLVVKYTPEGTRLWSTNVDSVPIQNDFTRTLVVDTTDQIFIVASIEDYDDDRLGTATIKIASDGRVLWTSVQTGFEVSPSTRMAVDVAGNAYVTGLAYQPATGADLATLKYDSNGTPVWQAHFAGPGTSYDAGTAVAVDDVGLGTDILLLHYREPASADPLRIGAMLMADGSFRLMTPPSNSALEVSSDLVNWARVEDAGELNRLYHTGIPMPGSIPQRFYRLVR
jgi:hypothetical protein